MDEPTMGERREMRRLEQYAMGFADHYLDWVTEQDLTRAVKTVMKRGTGDPTVALEKELMATETYLEHRREPAYLRRLGEQLSTKGGVNLTRGEVWGVAETFQYDGYPTREALRPAMNAQLEGMELENRYRGQGD